MSRQSRGADVTIGELSLRVSGISPRDAQLLGARVAQEVAAQIAAGARPRRTSAPWSSGYPSKQARGIRLPSASRATSCA